MISREPYESLSLPDRPGTPPHDHLEYHTEVGVLRYLYDDQDSMFIQEVEHVEESLSDFRDIDDIQDVSYHN